MDMKILMVAGAAISLVVLGIVFAGGNFLSGGSGQSGGAQVFGSNESVQNIVVSLNNGYYMPREIRIKQGTKVRLSADPNTLTGCMRTLVVQNYGRVVAGGAPLEFVADKPGAFRMSCPMGMGSGQIIVEDANGNVPGGIAPAAPPASGGGCGCGG